MNYLKLHEPKIIMKVNKKWKIALLKMNITIRQFPISDKVACIQDV